jgi:hypothetical protein
MSTNKASAVFHQLSGFCSERFAAHCRYELATIRQVCLCDYYLLMAMAD